MPASYFYLLRYLTSCTTVYVCHVFGCRLDNRILIAVASIRSTYQFNAEDINLHQMMILKVTSLPFGIYVFGTRKLITFDFIAALVSILGSMFLFIIGVNASS